MALTKYRIGQLIELTTETNESNLFNADDVRGMTITKQIIPTKADVSTADLRKFLVIRPAEFVFNPRTHGKHIGFGYNDTNESFLISWNNIGFRVKDKMKEVILSEYLFLHFNRDEWDREACFRSWGSSTEVFTWEALCEMTLELPDISVQRKYVDIYKAMVANQQCYERGLEDLKLTFEGYMDALRRKHTSKAIGEYLELVETTNDSLKYGIDDVMGISIEKKFIPTKADMAGVNLKPYYVIRPSEFAYVTVTSRNGEKISIALNESNDTYICSSSYVVFKSKDVEKLYPQYLMLYFTRSEFNRYARFCSWGSARETFDWSEMQEVAIPIPDIALQKSIANVYSAYIERKSINEQLKAQIKDICPILIRGSLEEGGER